MRKLPFLFAVALIVGTTTLFGCVDVPRDSLPFSVDPQVALRGKVLVEGLAACGSCHGNPIKPGAALTGGRLITTPQGSVQAPNITPSLSGIGNWDMQELFLSLRGVQSKDPEKEYYGSAHRAYEWISDEDAYSIFSYLKITDPIDKQMKRDHNADEASDPGMSNINNPGFVPSAKPISEASVGRYLAMRVGRCLDCHVTEEHENAWYLPDFLFAKEHDATKGRSIEFDGVKKEAPLILGKYSRQELLAFFDTGSVRKGKQVDPKFCPTQYFKNTPTEQKQALATFFSVKR